MQRRRRDGGAEQSTTSGPAGGAEEIDYEALGLWDDGPCDEAKPPLKIGLMTVFESPVVSLEDQAIALEVAAEAFNERGGANGGCIEVHTCDDGANVDQAVACVREIDDAGVVATVNDQGTAGQAEVSDSDGDGRDTPGRGERDLGRTGTTRTRTRSTRQAPAARSCTPARCSKPG